VGAFESARLYGFAVSMAVPERRVLFLFAHLHKGGMQRAVSNISQALPDTIQQYVGFFGTEHPPFTYHATLHDFMLPGSLNLGFLAKLNNFFQRLQKLRHYVQEQQIDVVVSFGEAANLLNILSCNTAYRVLCIRSAIGGYGNLNFYGRLYRSLIRWLYPYADAIVAVSQELQQQISTLIRRKVSVHRIPNLYHTQHIKALSLEPLPPEWSHLLHARFILNVGSLNKLKGQDLLIKAYALLCNSFPDLKLLLIGRGPDKALFQADAEQSGISDRVIFIDFDSNPYRYMRAATIFVLPSLTEGFPNVLVEAMACGSPVVAYDCPTGPREILGASEYGELVELMSVEALAESLRNLLSSPDRLCFLREQSQKRAKAYDAQHVVGQWVNLLLAGGVR
jgi:glycosyltransferase involved in cell wall biosynthesis